MHPFSPPLFITTFQVVHGSTLNARIPWTSSPLARIYIMCRGPLQSGHGPSLNTQYKATNVMHDQRTKQNNHQKHKLIPYVLLKVLPFSHISVSQRGRHSICPQNLQFLGAFIVSIFFGRGHSNSIKKIWTCEG